MRPWSAYELAQQATRSLRYAHPRTESHLYEEAKRLATYLTGPTGVATARKSGWRAASTQLPRWQVHVRQWDGPAVLLPASDGS